MGQTIKQQNDQGQWIKICQWIKLRPYRSNKYRAMKNWKSMQRWNKTSQRIGEQYSSNNTGQCKARIIKVKARIKVKEEQSK